MLIVATWKTAEAAQTAAITHKNVVTAAAERGRDPHGHQNPETRLSVMGAEIATYEAEDAARTSRQSAQIACDAADRDAGVELALACDPMTIATDVAALHAEVERIQGNRPR